MKKHIYLLLFVCFTGSLSAQPNIPFLLDNKNFVYRISQDTSINYDSKKDKKKALLFFDYFTKNAAQLLYTGCEFIYEKSQITIFPICFTDYVSKKSEELFTTEIPIQRYTIPLASDFHSLNLTEADFPLLVIYNEKNELCGYVKKAENITLIACHTEE